MTALKSKRFYCRREFTTRRGAQAFIASFQDADHSPQDAFVLGDDDPRVGTIVPLLKASSPNICEVGTRDCAYGIRDECKRGKACVL